MYWGVRLSGSRVSMLVFCDTDDGDAACCGEELYKFITARMVRTQGVVQSVFGC